MTQPEALRIVAMLTAYHRQELSNETALLWAQEIVENAITVQQLEAEGMTRMRFGAFHEGAERRANDRLHRDKMSQPYVKKKTRAEAIPAGKIPSVRAVQL